MNKQINLLFSLNAAVKTHKPIHVKKYGCKKVGVFIFVYIHVKKYAYIYIIVYMDPLDLLCQLPPKWNMMAGAASSLSYSVEKLGRQGTRFKICCKNH